MDDQTTHVSCRLCPLYIWEQKGNPVFSWVATPLLHPSSPWTLISSANAPMESHRVIEGGLTPVAVWQPPSPAFGGQKTGHVAMHNMQHDAAKNRQRLQTGSILRFQAINEC